MRDDLRAGRRETDGRDEDREQTKSVWVVEEEIARHQHHHQIRTGGGKYQSRTRTKKRGVISSGGRQTFGGIDTWWCAGGHAIRAQAPTTTALARRFTNRVKALRPRRRRRRGRRGRGHGRVSRHRRNLTTTRSGVEKTRKCPIRWRP
jgi:hypothetical protein